MRFARPLFLELIELICFDDASVNRSDVLKDLFDLKVGGLRMLVPSRKRGFVVFLSWGESKSFFILILQSGSTFLPGLADDLG